MRLLVTIFAMGFLTSLFGCKKSSSNDDKTSRGPLFVSEAAYQKNRYKQLGMSQQTMKQLRGYGVTDDSQLKLEYFFYTNTKAKAETLAKALSERGYNGGYDVAAGDPKQFVITGWTTAMKMSDDSVVKWTGEMTDLGFKFDCDFDGWGTNPNQ